MPNETVRERIVARMAATLASVRESLGYTVTLQNVFRTFRVPEMAIAVPYACVLGTSEDAEVGDPIQHYRIKLKVSVFVFIHADMAADPDADTKLNRAVGDIVRSILSDQAIAGGAAGSNVPQIVDQLLYEGFRRVPFGDGPSWVNGAEVLFMAEFVHHYQDPRLGRGET